ncbi:MAG: hypothetical protein K6E30_05185 [Lachnospiraceae bacterium]|nr:hypothetical protein [Lachnospiraceae bacterium]
MNGACIVAANAVALEETRLLMSRRSRELAGHFPSFFLRMAAEAVRERAVPVPEEALYYSSAGRGGIFSSLWRAGEFFRSGLCVDIKKIPIRQETIEILEYFDIDPYYGASADSFLAVLADPESYLARLKAAGIPGETIGRLVPGRARTLILGDRVRYLDRPAKDF